MTIPLGRDVPYPERYDAGLLAPLERAASRRAAGLPEALPWVGDDLWTCPEFSWLGTDGMPRIAALRWQVDANSPNLVESKSVKLYLNGFAQESFATQEAVLAVVVRDLGAAVGVPVRAELIDLDQLVVTPTLPGECLDALDIGADRYQRDPELLRQDAAGEVSDETLHSHRFRSLCPVTGQPDWASVLIRYRGRRLERAGLLRYLVSFRCEQGFHETTIERIFLDLRERCDCEQLLIGGYFVRRGGIDITPLRAAPGVELPAIRLTRQ